MADARDILLRLIGKETVSGAAKKAADGLGDLGDAADKAERDTKALDRALEDARKRMVDLQREAARTGDVSIRKQAQAAARDVKAWDALKKSLANAGEDGAQGFAARFSQRIGPLIASAPISPPILGAIAAAAPAASALISGAITAGAAVGALGIGAKLASQRTDVHKAMTGLAEEIQSALVYDTRPLVQPLLKSIDILKDGFRSIRPDIQAVFADAGKYAPSLARAASGFARELVPGIRDAVAAAQPLIEVLEVHGPRAAEAFSDALTKIASESANSAEALSTVLTAAEYGVKGFGGTMKYLNTILPFTSGPLLTINHLLTEEDRKSAEAAAAADKQSQAESRRAQAVARSAAEIEGMNRALADAPGEALAAEQAAVRTAQGWNSLKEALKGARADGKLTRAELVDLRGQTLSYAQSVLTEADAVKQQTGSQDAANAVLNRGRANFLKAAAAAHINADEAKKLADRLFGIPGKRETDIHVNKQAAERALGSFNSKANSAARDRSMTIHVNYSGLLPSFASEYRSGGMPGRAAGGPVLPGRQYIVGERGPELLQMGARGGNVVPNHRLGTDTSGIARELARALAGMTVNLDGRRVGEIQGRTADLYARGG